MFRGSALIVLLNIVVLPHMGRENYHVDQLQNLGHIFWLSCIHTNPVSLQNTNVLQLKLKVEFDLPPLQKKKLEMGKKSIVHSVPFQ